MRCQDWQLRPSDHHLINSRLNFNMMFVWYDAVVQIQLQSEWTLSAEASPAVNLSSRHFLLAGSKKHVSVRRLRQTAFKDPSLSISCWRKASDLTAQQDVCLSVWSWYKSEHDVLPVWYLQPERSSGEEFDHNGRIIHRSLRLVQSETSSPTDSNQSSWSHSCSLADELFTDELMQLN